jgi:hypothetical protein
VTVKKVKVYYSLDLQEPYSVELLISGSGVRVSNGPPQNPAKSKGYDVPESGIPGIVPKLCGFCADFVDRGGENGRGTGARA